MAKLGGDYLRLYNYPSSELYHHGIKGQKWGVRRFQNSDGSLTNAGRSRYTNDPTVVKSKENLKTSKKAYKKAQRKANVTSTANNIKKANLAKKNTKQQSLNTALMVKSVKEIKDDLTIPGTKELYKAAGETIAEDFIKKAGSLSAAGLSAGAVYTRKAKPKNYNETGG